MTIKQRKRLRRLLEAEKKILKGSSGGDGGCLPLIILIILILHSCG